MFCVNRLISCVLILFAGWDKCTSDLSTRVSSTELYKLMFYLTIVTKYYVTVTLGCRDRNKKRFRKVRLSVKVHL